MIYLDLFWTFFKIGAFTFGGGYAMLPMIQQQVALHGWLEQAQLLDFVAVSESTPGPFAVNIATYVGAQMGGIFGSLCATLGVVLPAFLVILIVAKCYIKFRESKIVKGTMVGLKAAVVGLISAAVLNTAKAVFFTDGFSLTILTTPAFWCAAVVFAAALVLLLRKKLHPIFIIVGSAAIGILCGYLGIC